jgi:two-component system, sensor histidine kinase and response regulator
VEDHPINQKLATHLLEKWGHRVTLAEDGQVAVDCIAAHMQYDVVLMDMQMPVMGGIEATRRIRELEAMHRLPRHPIVAMTANAMQGDREVCLEAGMDDYLSKPIRSPELLEKLRIFAPAGRRTPAAGSSAEPTGLSLVATFDYADAVSQMDPEIIEILAPTFLDHYQNELDSLRNAILTADTEEAMRRAHSLRGTLAAFGAQPAERRAAEMEALAKASDLDALSPLLDGLNAEIENLVMVLHQLSPD